MSMDPMGMYYDRAIPQTRRGTLVGQVMGLLAFSMLFTAGGYLVGRALGPAGMIISIVGTLACVLALSFARAKMSSTVALGLFYAFSVFEGMALGLIIDSYLARGMGSVVVNAATTTAALVLALGGYAWTTKRDLSGMGAYLMAGLLAVLLAGLLVRGSDRGLLVTAGSGVLLITLLYSGSGVALPDDPQAFLTSVIVSDPVEAARARAVEWAGLGLLVQAIGVFAAVALGAWAARRRLLDEPQRHRRLLRWVAVVGLAAAVLGGLPIALIAAQVWTSPSLVAALLSGSLHALSGYAGGLGYAALFGLLAIRLARDPGPLTHAVTACGQRSLSCYLAQSVAFVPLLPAWTLGLGADARLWQAALVGVGAWAVILVVAAASDRAGYRGPAELLLRRLTYGPRRTHQLA